MVDVETKLESIFDDLQLHKDNKDLQVSTLIYCMGSQAEEIFASFKWDAEDDKKDPAKVVTQFDKYFSLEKCHFQANKSQIQRTVHR